jgi:hypothetical protein
VRIQLTVQAHARDRLCWNPNSKTPEHHRPQHHCPPPTHPACFIAQQYSSDTFLSLHFTYHQEKSGAHFNNFTVWISFASFKFAYFWNCETRNCQSVSVCGEQIGEQIGEQASRLVSRFVNKRADWWADWWAGDQIGEQASRLVSRRAVWRTGERIGEQARGLVNRRADWWAGEQIGEQASRLAQFYLIQQLVSQTPFFIWRDCSLYDVAVLYMT